MWLRKSEARTFLDELRERQEALIAAILNADAKDEHVLAAARIAQGAKLVLDYIEGRIKAAMEEEGEEE